MPETDAFAASLLAQDDFADDEVFAPLPAALPALEDLPGPPVTSVNTAAIPDLPPAPNAADLLEPDTPIEKQITKLVETDALHAAGVSIVLGQRLAEMAMASQEIDEVRKAYMAMTARADLVEKRKVVSSTQVPLTIIFERAAVDTTKIDVRRGKDMQRLRDAAAAAEDATPA